MRKPLAVDAARRQRSRLDDANRRRTAPKRLFASTCMKLWILTVFICLLDFYGSTAT